MVEAGAGVGAPAASSTNACDAKPVEQMGKQTAMTGKS
jgi:hypothetical protein